MLGRSVEKNVKKIKGVKRGIEGWSCGIYLEKVRRKRSKKGEEEEIESKSRIEPRAKRA